MSVYYRNYVVYGVKGQIVDLVKNKTKYDENTGDPYTVKEKVGSIIVVNNEVLFDSISSEYTFERFMYEGKYDDMDVIFTNYENTEFVIGKIVGKTDIDDNVCEVNVDTSGCFDGSKIYSVFIAS